MIDKQITVAATAAEVFQAWTTTAGVLTFFAPQARIELRAGGTYELLFDLEAPAGSRGSEGCTVVSFEQDEELVVTWNFPPHLDEIRDVHTKVTVRFEALGERSTRVEVRHTGWQQGPQWEEGLAYFERAWGVVLDRLKQSFETGPVDWAVV